MRSICFAFSRAFGVKLLFHLPQGIGLELTRTSLLLQQKCFLHFVSHQSMNVFNPLWMPMSLRFSKQALPQCVLMAAH